MKLVIFVGLRLWFFDFSFVYVVNLNGREIVVSFLFIGSSILEIKRVILYWFE